MWQVGHNRHLAVFHARSDFREKHVTAGEWSEPRLDLSKWTPATHIHSARSGLDGEHRYEWHFVGILESGFVDSRIDLCQLRERCDRPGARKLLSHATNASCKSFSISLNWEPNTSRARTIPPLPASAGASMKSRGVISALAAM